MKNKKSTCSLGWCPPPDLSIYVFYIKGTWIAGGYRNEKVKKHQAFKVKQQFCMRIVLSVSFFTVYAQLRCEIMIKY